jgi:serine/threonine-protein kinase RsbW
MGGQRRVRVVQGCWGVALRAPGRAEEVAGLVDLAIDAAVEEGLRPAAEEGLRIALREALANALEHGNARDPDVDLEVRISRTREVLLIDVVDDGHGDPPTGALPAPDARRQVTGEQPLGGWGLWLMRRSVDDVEVVRDEGRRRVRLRLQLDGS